MLRLVGWLYGRIINIRNSLYDRGIFKSHSLGARTISIGNITTGGTGKTPLVAHVAEILSHTGEKVCILTRGYRRESSGRVLVSDGENVLVDAREGGDEPVELAQKLLGKAIVIADADRVSAAAWARERFGVTAFVLDDAFQHRRAKRDLDIVCIDATDPFGGGLLREPLRNLARADAIVITRSDLVESVEPLIAEIRKYNPAPVFKARYDLATPYRVERRDLTMDFAFCGIGNPQNFFKMLIAHGLDPANTRAFPDHHPYTVNDVERLESEARSKGCSALITTWKDAVKLDRLKLGMALSVAEIEVVIDDPEAFRDLVLSA